MRLARGAAGASGRVCDARRVAAFRVFRRPFVGVAPSPGIASAPVPVVCTRSGGWRAPFGVRSAPVLGVCTRGGGWEGRHAGAVPPFRVQTPDPGADVPPNHPRLGCRPPFRVQAPVLGAELPPRRARDRVCTRSGCLHPFRGLEGAVWGQVCTRFGGLHPWRGLGGATRRGGTPVSGADPRSGCRCAAESPPFGVQTPVSGAGPRSGAELPPPAPGTASAPVPVVCTRFGGWRAPFGVRSAPVLGVCTRGGGWEGRHAGAVPPFQVQTPDPGADVPPNHPRSGCRPPFRVQVRSRHRAARPPPRRTAATAARPPPHRRATHHHRRSPGRREAEAAERTEATKGRTTWPRRSLSRRPGVWPRSG